MLPDEVSNPGPLTYESGALPIALCGPARIKESDLVIRTVLKELMIQRTLVITTLFVTKDFAVKLNLLL